MAHMEPLIDLPRAETLLSLLLHPTLQLRAGEGEDVRFAGILRIQA